MRIERGEVEILRESGDMSIVLCTGLAGQFVGEMGVIERRARNATARATKASRSSSGSGRGRREIRCWKNAWPNGSERAQ